MNSSFAGRSKRKRAACKRAARQRATPAFRMFVYCSPGKKETIAFNGLSCRLTPQGWARIVVLVCI